VFGVISRLAAARQVVDGLAHRTEPLAQRVDGGSFRQHSFVDCQSGDLGGLDGVGGVERRDVTQQGGIGVERCAPCGERLRRGRRQIGEISQLGRDAFKARQFCAHPHRPLPARQGAATAAVLGIQPVQICSRFLHRRFKIAHRLAVTMASRNALSALSRRSAAK